MPSSPVPPGGWTIYVCPEHGLRQGADPTYSRLNNWCERCGAFVSTPVDVVPVSTSLSETAAVPPDKPKGAA